LLTDLLDAEIETSGVELDGLVDRANTLGLEHPETLYDAIIGNPPYGRILQPSGSLRKRYHSVISDGYVNLYVLFVDHIIVLGEMHLRRVLKSYADYYNSVRTPRSLNKDAPVTRQIQRIGSIISHAILGGLHHHYARA
jgi:hypothetical protein